jgi:hypothetical protein
MAKRASKKASKAKKGSAPAGSKAWSVLAGVSAVGAAAISKKVLDSSWRAVTGRKPPTDPSDPQVATWEAVTWAAATGAGVALARLLAQRGVAAYQAKSALPPAERAPSSAKHS